MNENTGIHVGPLTEITPKPAYFVSRGEKLLTLTVATMHSINIYINETISFIP